MKANIYCCPECRAECFAVSLAAFRCPQCGYAGGNQLSIFRQHRENTGAIKYLRPFDPEEVARRAYARQERER